MPLTRAGLQEVGLADWPAWFRAMNPGYFAAEPQPSALRTQGSHLMKGGNLGTGFLGRVSGSGRGREPKQQGQQAGQEKEKELGRQILERSRYLRKKDAGHKSEMTKSCQSILLDRAQDKDTKDWEDEGSSTEVEEIALEEQKRVPTEEKLVDV